jgi:hypothetical protein
VRRVKFSESAQTFHQCKEMKGLRVCRRAINTTSARGIATFARSVPSYRLASGALFGGLTFSAVAFAVASSNAEEAPAVDYKKVEEDLKKLIKSAGTYDDGRYSIASNYSTQQECKRVAHESYECFFFFAFFSPSSLVSYGPLFIRLAWHAAGSYSKHDKTGGSNGAAMRYPPEAGHGGNAGLYIARGLLEDIKKRYPGLSYADLYSLAGTVAIEALGGPRAKWRPGRVDYPSPDSFKPTPDGRLPDAAQGADHLRSIFYRMGFTDQEIVALSGAHVLGRCHKDRSGFDGPWSNNPTFFSNDYFRYVDVCSNRSAIPFADKLSLLCCNHSLLLDETWTVRQWNGPRQFEDKSKKLMMLPSDMALLDDPAFSHWVHAYAQDEDLFFRDFATAWTKLQDLGVQEFNKPVFKKLFG